MRTENNALVTADDIYAEIPRPIIWRPQAASVVGWKQKTLVNADSRGAGCPNKIRHGNKVGYPSRDFAEWAAAKLNS